MANGSKTSLEGPAFSHIQHAAIWAQGRAILSPYTLTVRIPGCSGQPFCCMPAEAVECVTRGRGRKKSQVPSIVCRTPQGLRSMNP